MSKIESKKRILRRKISRKIDIISNVFFLVIFLVGIILLSTHLITKKKEYRNMGIESFNAENYSSAIEYFDKALNCNQWFSDSINVDICLYKAESYIRINNFEEAKKVYDNLVAKYSSNYYNEDDIKFMSELCSALISYSNKEYSACIPKLVEAVDRGYYRVSIFTAIAYKNLNKLDDMIKYYDIYRSKFGDNSYLYYQYASYYAKQEDYEEALRYANSGASCGDTVYIEDIKYIQILCQTKLKEFDTAYNYAKTFVSEYPYNEKGKELYNYLDSRVNLKKKPVNDIYGLGDESDDSSDEETTEYIDTIEE